jgi:hypothetical protein
VKGGSGEEWTRQEEGRRPLYHWLLKTPL